MRANKTLLRMKCARVVAGFAERCGISELEALRQFYGSLTYRMIRDGVDDIHCRSDGYLVDELMIECGRMPDPERYDA